MSVQKQGSINTAHCSDYWGQVNTKRKSSLLGIVLHVRVYACTLRLPSLVPRPFFATFFFSLRIFNAVYGIRNDIR